MISARTEIPRRDDTKSETRDSQASTQRGYLEYYFGSAENGQNVDFRPFVPHSRFMTIYRRQTAFIGPIMDPIFVHI